MLKESSFWEHCIIILRTCGLLKTFHLIPVNILLLSQSTQVRTLKEGIFNFILGSLKRGRRRR